MKLYRIRWDTATDHACIGNPPLELPRRAALEECERRRRGGSASETSYADLAWSIEFARATPECPTCHKPTLTPLEIGREYQCSECCERTEGIFS